MQKTGIRKMMALLVLTLSMAFCLGLTASAQTKATLPARVKSSGQTAAKVSWKKVSGADKYVVYYTKCYTSFSAKQKKTVSGSKSCCVIKNLSKKGMYKFKVNAYSGSKLLAASLKIHLAAPRNARYTNPKSIKVGPSSATLAEGGTLTLVADITKEKASKKLITHDASLRFFSSDDAVATVSANGTVTAVKAGTCLIYAVAENGVWKTVRITVTAGQGETKVEEVEVVKEEKVYVLSYASKFEGGRPPADPKLPAPVKLKAGATVNLVTPPEIEGYTFEGWDFSGNTMPEKDVVVTGTWKKIETFTITYVLLSLDTDYAASVIGTASTGPYKKGTLISLDDISGFNPYIILSKTDYLRPGSSGPQFMISHSHYFCTWVTPDMLEEFLEDALRSTPEIDLTSADLPEKYAIDFPGDIDHFVTDEDEYSETYGETKLVLDQNYVLFEMVDNRPQY